MQIRLYLLIVSITFFLFCCRKEKQNLIKSDSGILELDSTYIGPNGDVGGYYSAIPQRYSQSSKPSPLLLFIHGNGQIGNGKEDLASLLFGGIPRIINEGKFSDNFNVSGQSFSFIVIAPQFRSKPNAESIHAFLNFCLAKYRIDSTRVYLTGLSAGGRAACDAAAEDPERFAALICMAGVSTNGNIAQKAKSIRENNLPTWIFQNEGDLSFPFEYSERFYTLLKQVQSNADIRFTSFQARGLDGHDAWTTASDPTYREEGKNIYEWMLQFKR